MKVSAVIVSVALCIAGVEAGAQAAEGGAIDTVLVRTLDLTGDGKADTVSLHLTAKNLESPFSWTLSIHSAGSLLLSRSHDDSDIDTLFRDKGFVGDECKGYRECKRQYYFHDILNGLEARYSVEAVLDRTQSNTLCSVGGEYLASCCGIEGAAAEAILSGLEKRLRKGGAVVISIPISPVQSEPPVMYAPEVKKFVPIYEE